MSPYLIPVLLFTLLLTAACENSLEEVKQIGELQQQVETVKGVELIYSESGNTKVKLTAPTLLRHKTKDPYLEFPDGVDVTFYNDNLSVGSTLTARYGIRKERQKLTTVRDSVVWINKKEGKTIESEEMNWDERNSKIHTDKFVKITTPSGVILGKAGFEANQDFSNLRIKKVEGEINPNAILKE